MKNIKHFVVLATALIFTTKNVSFAASPEDFTIASFTVTGGQGVLAWSGGRPTYQVQTRSNFTANWSNLGGPTSNTVAVVPATDAPAF